MNDFVVMVLVLVALATAGNFAFETNSFGACLGDHNTWIRLCK